MFCRSRIGQNGAVAQPGLTLPTLQPGQPEQNGIPVDPLFRLTLLGQPQVPQDQQDGSSRPRTTLDKIHDTASAYAKSMRYKQKATVSLFNLDVLYNRRARLLSALDEHRNDNRRDEFEQRCQAALKDYNKELKNYNTLVAMENAYSDLGSSLMA